MLLSADNVSNVSYQHMETPLDCIGVLTSLIHYSCQFVTMPFLKWSNLKYYIYMLYIAALQLVKCLAQRDANLLCFACWAFCQSLFVSFKRFPCVAERVARSHHMSARHFVRNVLQRPYIYRGKKKIQYKR